MAEVKDRGGPGPERTDVHHGPRARGPLRHHRHGLDQRRRPTGLRHRHRRGADLLPVLLLGQDRDVLDARERGDARTRTQAAPDRRPTLPARGHEEAARRRRRDRHPQRLRHRSQPEPRGDLRDAGPDEPPERRGARGGAGARTQPRRAPRRGDHDHRLGRGHAGRPGESHRLWSTMLGGRRPRQERPATRALRDSRPAWSRS